MPFSVIDVIAPNNAPTTGVNIKGQTYPESAYVIGNILTVNGAIPISDDPANTAIITGICWDPAGVILALKPISDPL